MNVREQLVKALQDYLEAADGKKLSEDWNDTLIIPYGKGQLLHVPMSALLIPFPSERKKS